MKERKPYDYMSCPAVKFHIRVRRKLYDKMMGKLGVPGLIIRYCKQVAFDFSLQSGKFAFQTMDREDFKGKFPRQHIIDHHVELVWEMMKEDGFMSHDERYNSEEYDLSKPEIKAMIAGAVELVCFVDNQVNLLNERHLPYVK